MVELLLVSQVAVRRGGSTARLHHVLGVRRRECDHCPVDSSASNMDTDAFLRRHRREMIDAAENALVRLGVRHYQSADEHEVRRRLEVLFDQLVDTLADRDLAPMVAYAQAIAEERFNAGYDLSEVQAAFNSLEESIWTQAVAALEPGQLAPTLGLVSTALGCGKDALARKYVSLATRAHAPSLDLRALFSGGDEAAP